MTISKRYRVALAGYYGFGNLGDELLAEAALSALSRCGIERGSIVLLSNDPEDSTRKFKTEAVNRWNLKQVSAALRESETLLFGGGGLFQDATSLRSCAYYWGLVRLAWFHKAVPWALGQSVGPLSNGLGRWLTRDALKRCRVFQVRDVRSHQLCASLGLSVEKGHDLVLSLGEVLSVRTSKNENQKKKFLLNLRPCGNALPERFADAFFAALVSSSFTGEVVGVALAEEDESLIRRLMAQGHLTCSRIERIASPEDVARVFAGAEAAAGMRLHFAVLSALNKIPLVAVPYDPKVSAFATDWNIPLWNEGDLPKPRVPAPAWDLSSEFLQEEVDTLCRIVLK